MRFEDKCANFRLMNSSSESYIKPQCSCYLVDALWSQNILLIITELYALFVCQWSSTIILQQIFHYFLSIKIINSLLPSVGIECLMGCGSYDKLTFFQKKNSLHKD